MSRRKQRGGGNLLTEGLSRLLDTVGGEVIDGIIEVGSGRKDSKKTSRPSSSDTDWATRLPAAPRKRRP